MMTLRFTSPKNGGSKTTAQSSLKYSQTLSRKTPTLPGSATAPAGRAAVPQRIETRQVKSPD